MSSQQTMLKSELKSILEHKEICELQIENSRTRQEKFHKKMQDTYEIEDHGLWKVLGLPTQPDLKEDRKRIADNLAEENKYMCNIKEKYAQLQSKIESLQQQIAKFQNNPQ